MNTVVTQTAKVWLDDDTGFVNLEPHARRKQELADAVENVAAVRTVAQGVKRPLLVHFQSAVPQSPECRAHYTSRESAHSITAVAIVTSSTLGRIIGNLMIGMQQADVPARLFDDVKSATAWLKTVQPGQRRRMQTPDQPQGPA